MDVIENGTTSLKKVSRHKNIHQVLHLFAHLYGKIRSQETWARGCANGKGKLRCGSFGFSYARSWALN